MLRNEKHEFQSPVSMLSCLHSEFFRSQPHSSLKPGTQLKLGSVILYLT